MSVERQGEGVEQRFAIDRWHSLGGPGQQSGLGFEHPIEVVAPLIERIGFGRTSGSRQLMPEDDVAELSLGQVSGPGSVDGGGVESPRHVGRLRLALG